MDEMDRLLHADTVTDADSGILADAIEHLTSLPALSVDLVMTILSRKRAPIRDSRSC